MPCKIYEDRPEFCVVYPFEKRLDPSSNVFAPRVKECQYNAESGWVTYEELSQMKSSEEIADYCNNCNICCWLPAGTVFDFGEERNEEIDWSKVFVDKEYLMESGRLCEYCELPDTSEKQEKLLQIEPMGVAG